MTARGVAAKDSACEIERKIAHSNKLHDTPPPRLKGEGTYKQAITAYLQDKVGAQPFENQFEGSPYSLERPVQ